MPTCPRCGQPNPDGARFCNACGAALQTEAPPPLDERKVVTVLFCDIVGFTARAERLDPEDVHAMLVPYHARLRSELERRGGTVEKFIGDAVMAVFGAPAAHEDDPERAVRAAFAIRDSLAEEGTLEARIGITTGEVLIALSVRPESGEGFASGDVVNTAARLETAAPPGGILVDDTTYWATRRTIDYREAAPVVAKGKAEPVPAWEALGARAPVGVERHSGAPLVGRGRELTLLRESFERVRREFGPQLVTLVGVPGIGKSRLVSELAAELEEGPEPVRWLQGRSLPYGEGVTFWALGEVVKGEAGILESDDSDQAGRKLVASVESVIHELHEASWIEANLRPLVGIEAEDVGGADGRSEAFAAWRRYLEALATDAPLVLVFEDLHWADDALLDFVDHLVEWASAVPLFLLATTRPELLVRRPGWGGGMVNSATILLPPLSDDEASTLVRELLGSDALGTEDLGALLERAGGNPLYAEEFAFMLTERRDRSALPESVQGIIAARLDALPREEKELLQDAAVMGRVFWRSALGTDHPDLDELLHALARKEFVRRERRSAVAGDTEFAFRHGLIRDVAYEQIPRARRARKHRAVAEWIESLGRPEDHAEMLAHHYLQTLEYAQALGESPGELGARAAAALREAGDRALSLDAYPTAIRYYEQALAMVPAGDGADAARCELLLSLGEARARGGEDALAKESFLSAAALARDSGTPAQLARAALGYGGRFVWSRSWGDRHLIPLLEEALAALPERDDPLRVRLMARLASGPMRDTHPTGPREALSQEALDMARRLGEPSTLAYAVDGRHCANMGPGSVELRLSMADELISVSGAAGDRERAFEGHDYRLHALLELGDLPAVMEESRALTELAGELRQPAQLWFAVVNDAKLALLQGRLQDADGWIGEARDLGRLALGANARMAFDLQTYAIRREQGRLAEMVDVVERAVDDYPAYPIWPYVLADTLAALGRLDEATVAFEALAVKGFPLYLEMQWLFGMSLAAEVCGTLGDAERAATLYALLRPHGALNAVLPPELCRGSVARDLGNLAATMSRWDDSFLHFEKALEANGRMGARPWLAHARHDYARALLARNGRGDGERARELLVAAAETSTADGMDALSDQIAGLLSELGAPSP